MALSVIGRYRVAEIPGLRPAAAVIAPRDRLFAYRALLHAGLAFVLSLQRRRAAELASRTKMLRTRCQQRREGFADARAICFRCPEVSLYFWLVYGAAIGSSSVRPILGWRIKLERWGFWLADFSDGFHLAESCLSEYRTPRFDAFFRCVFDWINESVDFIGLLEPNTLATWSIPFGLLLYFHRMGVPL